MKSPAIRTSNSACRIVRLRALKLSASLRSMSGGDARSRGNIPERKVRLQVFYRLAIGLRVGIDKVVQGVAFLVGRETDVAAVGEENALVSCAPKKKSRLAGFFQASEASTGTQPTPAR